MADMAQIWRSCGCGIGCAAAAPILPLAWELPFAIGAAIKKENKNKKIIFYSETKS